MKRILITACLLASLYYSCTKSSGNTGLCTDTDPTVEAPAIQSFCTANGINYTVDSTGLYYEIIDSGAAPKPTLNSVVSVIYTAKLLNGTIIDQRTTPVDNQLGALIQAWRVGMVKIGKGGHIKMVAPSSMCYGCYGTGPTSTFQVPANAVLYFDVTLKDVK